MSGYSVQCTRGWCRLYDCEQKRYTLCGMDEPLADLFVHDGGQLSGQVPVVGLHLIMVLLLVLLYQALIHTQGLTTGVHKLPAQKYFHEVEYFSRAELALLIIF